MNVSELLNQATKLVKRNAPEILTALGVGGVVTTSYLVGKASFRAKQIIDESEAAGGISDDPKTRLKEQVKLTWKEYIPAGISGAATITCIIASNRTGDRRTAAAVAAYSLTEKAFGEYKEKVKEQITANKEQKIRDEIAQDRVNANPVSTREVVVTGKGEHLCYEVRSCRYFRSTMAELKRAENEINYQLNYERTVGLSEFYALIGLSITKESVYNGWNLDRGLMELDISTTISDSDEPCFVIDYNYVQPLHDSHSPDCN